MEEKTRGYAICDISFSSATIPKAPIFQSHIRPASKKTTLHRKAQGINPFWVQRTENQCKQEIKHQFQTNITIQDTNPGFLINVLAGSVSPGQASGN